MFLIDLLIVGLTAIAIATQKESLKVEQEELVPVPVKDK